MSEHQIDPDVVHIIEETVRALRDSPAAAVCEMIMLRLWEAGFEIRARAEDAEAGPPAGG